MMKFYKDTGVLFSHRLTSYVSQKSNRNNYNLLKCTSGFVQTNVLINFFISLRQAEAITLENFARTKWDPSSTKEGSHLVMMKLFTCNCKI